VNSSITMRKPANGPFSTSNDGRCLVTAPLRSRTSRPMIRRGIAATTPATRNTSRYLFGWSVHTRRSP